MSMITYLFFLFPILIIAKQKPSPTTQLTSFTVTVRVQRGNDAHLNNLRKA